MTDEFDDNYDYRIILKMSSDLRKSWSSRVRTMSPLIMFKELASSSLETYLY